MSDRPRDAELKSELDELPEHGGEGEYDVNGADTTMDGEILKRLKRLERHREKAVKIYCVFMTLMHKVQELHITERLCSLLGIDPLALQLCVPVASLRCQIAERHQIKAAAESLKKARQARKNLLADREDASEPFERLLGTAAVMAFLQAGGGPTAFGDIAEATQVDKARNRQMRKRADKAYMDQDRKLTERIRDTLAKNHSLLSPRGRAHGADPSVSSDPATQTTQRRTTADHKATLPKTLRKPKAPQRTALSSDSAPSKGAGRGAEQPTPPVVLEALKVFELQMQSHSSEVEEKRKVAEEKSSSSYTIGGINLFGSFRELERQHVELDKMAWDLPNERSYLWYLDIFSGLMTTIKNKAGWYHSRILWSLVFMQNTNGSFEISPNLAAVLCAGDTSYLITDKPTAYIPEDTLKQSTPPELFVLFPDVGLAHRIWATMCAVERIKQLPFEWIINPEDPPRERRTLTEIANTYIDNQFRTMELNPAISLMLITMTEEVEASKTFKRLRKMRSGTIARGRQGSVEKKVRHKAKEAVEAWVKVHVLAMARLK
eukprot:gene18590-22197_t